MMCKKSNSDNWVCMELNEDDRWEDFGYFDEVNLKSKDAKLFLAAGHVVFDGDDCEVDNGGNLKTLECG